MQADGQADDKNVKLVQRWLYENATTYIQRTPEWEEARRYVVGGSSIGAIQGTNPYQSVGDFIDQKIAINAISIANTKTQWGVMFEPVIEKSTKQDLACKIFGENAFILGGDEFPNTAYSPDGIAVVPYERLHIISPSTQQPMVWSDDVAAAGASGATGTTQSTIVLLEFKCPFSRMIRYQTEPPASYVAQIKMGLELIPIASFGVLIEATFRRCSWGMLGPSNEHSLMYTQPKLRMNPAKCGVIGYAVNGPLSQVLASAVSLRDIMLSNETPQARFMREFTAAGFTDNSHIASVPADVPVEDIEPVSLNDFGSCSIALFEGLLSILNPNTITQWTGPIFPADSPTLVEDLEAAVTEFEADMRKERQTVIGIVPYKLYPNIKYSKVEPERGFLKPFLPRISSTIDCIKKCNSMSSLEDKIRLRDKYVQGM